MYEIPTKPRPNNIKYPAALQKVEIKKSTAITGFLEVITKIPDKIAPAANTSNKKLFIIFVFVFNCAYAFAFLNIYFGLGGPKVFTLGIPPTRRVGEDKW